MESTFDDSTFDDEPEKIYSEDDLALIAVYTDDKLYVYTASRRHYSQVGLAGDCAHYRRLDTEA
jgi:hypothetical protein